jgi:hypothetical protein
MKLSTVLKSVREAQPATEKTAAVSGSGQAESSGEKLKTALHEALTPPPDETKQASTATSPVQDLEKIAAQVTASEQEALTKEAQLYGAAVADGFMARLAQYNEAAEKLAAQQPAAQAIPGRVVELVQPAKTAADDSFEKFAQENPQLVKEAAELGYATTMGQMEKLAETAHKKGFEEATVSIYKFAHDSFVRGFQDASSVLQSLKR